MAGSNWKQQAGNGTRQAAKRTKDSQKQLAVLTCMQLKDDPGSASLAQGPNALEEIILKKLYLTRSHCRGLYGGAVQEWPCQLMTARPSRHVIQSIVIASIVEMMSTQDPARAVTKANHTAVTDHVALYKHNVMLKLGALQCISQQSGHRACCTSDMHNVSRCFTKQ